ncbi:MAG: exodeoxyribonuclease VII large subunit, partial [Sphingopyxis sp.]
MPTPKGEDGDSGDARLVAQECSGDNAAPLSVAQLSAAIKRVVEQGFDHVRVRGEISGFKRAASGHIYFALKDADAKIDAVMWRGAAARIPFAAEDGLD